MPALLPTAAPVLMVAAAPPLVPEAPVSTAELLEPQAVPATPLRGLVLYSHVLGEGMRKYLEYRAFRGCLGHLWTLA